VEETAPEMPPHTPWGASDEEWNDWRWHVRHRITLPGQLSRVLRLVEGEKKGIKECLKFLRMAITPYYASLMDPSDPSCAVRRQAVPTAQELQILPWEHPDSLAEEVDSPVLGLTHRYPDRVLLLVTDQCFTYCRHCTRRRLVGVTDRPASRERIEKAVRYIARTPAIRDVLVSGGDPLTLSDDRLELILKALRSIPHVEIIRIGTRAPAVLPQRVTESLCRMLTKYHPIWINLHFNHPKEITPEAKKACALLADAGIPLGNQSVLLRGVNDCPSIQKDLVHRLLAARVRPYYLYQCDLSPGLGHFRTSIRKGIEIIENLRGHTSGIGVATFVVDLPGGGGKVPVGPNYVISMSEDKVVFRNFEGVMTAYTETPGSSFHCPPGCTICGDKAEAAGVATLLGERLTLEPSGLERARRRRHWGKGEGEKAESFPLLERRYWTAPLKR